ncbi:MAG: DUF1156 domain-containing protein [Dethiobacteria bacterium]
MNKKKLIEVALPLDAINKASAREKSIRHGHPSTLHLWWARRPLAAARAVIFAQMVDDPSTYVDELRSDAKRRRKAESVLKARKKIWDEAKRIYDLAAKSNIPAPDPGPEPTLDEILAELERERLFKIIEDLVLWENTTNEEVLQRARDEIWQSWRRTCAENADHPRAKELFDRHKLPAFHDPFAGGGSLPLEAQRLGLEAYASDLNPVAVLINKAMIEIPPKFAGMPPVNPEAREKQEFFKQTWKGAQGLAEDVRYYGKWMRDEAEKRIGHLYPKVEITEEMVNNPENPRPDLKPYLGRKLTVIAWIWARTVKSPNPAFAHVDVPLASTFMLSTKKGKEAYIEPIIEGDSYRFTVKVGKPDNVEEVKKGTKLSRGANFKCLMSGTPINDTYIKTESMAGRIGVRLIAIVAEGERGRVYIEPTLEHETIAMQVKPEWKPEQEMNRNTRDLVSGRGYGFFTWGDIFTNRQLVALKTFSSLVQEASELVKNDVLVTSLSDIKNSFFERGNILSAYVDAVRVYLAFAIDKGANYWSSFCSWHSGRDTVTSTFGRQALPMVWDYAEANPFSDSSGNFLSGIYQAERQLCLVPTSTEGKANQANATIQLISKEKVISTDPPYYDNIAYADLSDFFYIWLRLSLKQIFPELFVTLTVPKTEELIASSYRHDSKEKAEAFFLEGMARAMQRLAEQAHPTFPVTIYYAFKQSESNSDIGTASTGWETFLEAVIHAGFTISGTWPVRTEYTGNLKKNVGALASSIVLVCRKRPADAPTATRREFLKALKTELPAALANLQRGNIAPVDLAQAAIGPGMAVYTRYSRVLDAEGKAVTVREALTLINQILDEVLAEQEGSFDADTRWAMAWFEQYGFNEGEYGVAETLSKAKNTSVQGMAQAGIISSKGGKVRLLRPDELSKVWDPHSDLRLTVWEMVHQLIRALEHSESTAAALMAKLGTRADTARELAYRLYTVCERKKWAQEAMAYNGLVQSGPEIARLAQELKDNMYRQQNIIYEE